MCVRVHAQTVCVYISVLACVLVKPPSASSHILPNREMAGVLAEAVVRTAIKKNRREKKDAAELKCAM